MEKKVFLVDKNISRSIWLSRLETKDILRNSFLDRIQFEKWVLLGSGLSEYNTDGGLSPKFSPDIISLKPISQPFFFAVFLKCSFSTLQLWWGLGFGKSSRQVLSHPSNLLKTSASEKQYEKLCAHWLLRGKPSRSKTDDILKLLEKGEGGGDTSLLWSNGPCPKNGPNPFSLPVAYETR